MKIAVFRHRGRTVERTFRWEAGCGGLASCLNGKFLNHIDAYNTKLDYALMVTGKKECEYIATVGKSPNWGKLISIPCSDGWSINDPEYIELVRRAGFDAFITPPSKLFEMYKIFGIPVVPYCYPYDTTPVTTAKANKVVLYVKNLRNINTNFLTTLTIFKHLPKHISAITTTNPAAPYKEDVALLQEMVNKFGMSKRVEVIKPLSRENYIKKISNCRVIIDMDNRNVWGRNVLDAITIKAINVGTPSVYQEMFFKDYITSGVHDTAIKVMKAFETPFPKLDTKILTPEYSLNDLREKLSKI